MTARLAQAQVRTPAERRRTAALILLLHALPIWAILSGTSSTDWLFFACLYPAAGLGVTVDGAILVEIREELLGARRRFQEAAEKMAAYEYYDDFDQDVVRGYLRHEIA